MEMPRPPSHSPSPQPLPRPNVCPNDSFLERFLSADAHFFYCSLFFPPFHPRSSSNPAFDGEVFFFPDLLRRLYFFSPPTLPPQHFFVRCFTAKVTAFNVFPARNPLFQFFRGKDLPFKKNHRPSPRSCPPARRFPPPCLFCHPFFARAKLPPRSWFPSRLLLIVPGKENHFFCPRSPPHFPWRRLLRKKEFTSSQSHLPGSSAKN